MKSASEFKPDQQTLIQLKQLLRDIHVGNDAVQKRVSRELGKISDHEDFTLYCCAVLGDPNEQDIGLRYTAGICLKSVLGRSYGSIDNPRRSFIEECIFVCCSDKNELIRKAGKLSLVTVVSAKGITDLIADALDCLAQIFQDINMNFENVNDPDKIFGSPFVNELIGKLITLIEPAYQTNIRLPSFECLTNLLVSSPPELIARTQILVTKMLTMTEDPEPKIRQRVYAYLLGLCQIRKDLFVSQSDEIFPKMAVCLGDFDKDARRACFMIFWEFLSVHETEESSQVIQLILPHLETIMPNLLSNSVLSDEDKENLLLSVAQFMEKNTIYEKGLQSDEEEGLDLDVDEEDEDEDANGAYTLRKISLRCIEKIFQFLGNNAFPFIKTRLDNMMQSDDILVKEAAFAVFGAIGDFCFDEIKAHLGQILSYVLKISSETHNQFLKSTGIWTIRKYRDHLLTDHTPETKAFMLQYLDLILVTIKGNLPVAQDSAATALKKLCKSKADMIIELHDKLVELFASILTQNTYNKVFVYDTLAQFVESLEDEEQKSKVLQVLMPLLVREFEAVNIHDGAFVPLFECVISIQRVCGMEMSPWIDVILRRVIFITTEITNVLRAGNNIRSKSKERIKLEYELNENLMRCIDFIGGLADSTEGQFVKFGPIVKELPGLLFINMDTDNVFLKQLVYSTLGDLIAYLEPALFEQHIDNCLKLLVEDCVVMSESMDPGRTYLSVATNALYAIGEIIPKFPNKIPAEVIIQKLLKIFQSPKLHKFLVINCALVFGRLGLFYSEVTSRYLRECLKKVGFGLIYAKDENEGKRDAFLGLNAAIIRNPVDFLPNMSFWLEAVGVYENPPAEVAESVKRILIELNNGDSTIRTKVIASLNDLTKVARASLAQRYGFSS